MPKNTEGFGDNSFFAGCPVSPFQSSELSALGFGVDFVQMGQCSPHLHSSSALFWGGIVWGIAANLGGVLSSAISVLIKVGVGTSPL